MTIVGIDPSTKMPAWCRVNGKGEIRYGKSTLEPLEQWIDLFRGADLVVIEGQYLGINTRSLISLSYAVGEIMACAKLAGVEEIEIIPPGMWQEAMLRARRIKRQERKSLSKKVASALIGESIEDSDIADAILLTLYAKIRDKGGENAK